MSINMSEICMWKEIKYMCSCGSQRPITRIYFCRHCSKLRCGECVSHEVDSHYCQNSGLEYMPSPEARLKRNKCANCFDCPSCMHTLSTRATSVQIPTPEDPNKTVPKKVYYLMCGFCHWTSRDVGIPDQTAGSASHFRVTIVSQAFDNKTLVQRHRMVNEILKDELKGPIHALSIQAISPAQQKELASQRKKSPPCKGGMGL